MSKQALSTITSSAPAAASPQAAASTSGSHGSASTGAADAAGDGDGAEDSLQIPMDELGADEAALLATWKAGGTKAGAGTDDDKSKAGTAAGAGGDDGDDASGEDTPEAEADEADADSGEEEETEDGEDDEDEKPESDKTPVQKRIDKLTAQKKTLQTQVEQLTAENQQLKAGGPKPGQPIALVPMAEDPLSHLASAADVSAAMESAKATIAWCKANRHGASVPKESGSTEKVELTAEQVAEIREEQEELLKEHGPGRLKWLQNWDKSHADALQAYPDLFKAGSKDQEFVREMIQHVPGLARHPMHELFLGDMLVGANIRTGRMKVLRVNAGAAASAGAGTPAKTAAAPAPAPKPSLGSAAAAPAARPRGAGFDTSAVRDAALKGTMDPDDAAEAMFASKFG